MEYALLLMRSEELLVGGKKILTKLRKFRKNPVKTQRFFTDHYWPHLSLHCPETSPAFSPPAPCFIGFFLIYHHTHPNKELCLMKHFTGFTLHSHYWKC